MNQRSNFEIVVKALGTKCPVELDGMRYRLVKAGEPFTAASGDYVSDTDIIVMELTQVSNGEQSIIHLPVQLSINDFIRLCEKLTEDELLNLVFSTALAAL